MPSRKATDSDEVVQIVAANLRLLADKRHMTAGDLASETGLPHMVVYRALRGEVDPKISTVVLLARVLRVRIDALTRKE